VLNKADIKIVQVTLSPRRAWEIKTDKGLKIALGRVDMETRLDKFARAYTSTLSQLNVKVTYADLRYPNGFAVRKPANMKSQVQVPLSETAKPAVKTNAALQVKA
jgi:cell division protein FtsQ